MSRPRSGRSGRRLDAMQVTETLNEGLKHEFKVNVPASDLDAKADARLVDLKDKVRLNGFRPGKVPVSHLKKVYGRSVMAETIDQTIRDTNTQIFTERGFRLATEPKITMPTEQKEVEQILSGKSDLTYTVSIEVVPAIQLADFKSFKVEKPVAEVSDADVDEAIKRIADQNRSYAAKGEGAKADSGDRVTINFKGTIEGVAFRSGKSDLTYTVSIEVVPAIQLADFKSFKVEKPVAEVSDADVDEAIKRIADQNRSYAAKGEGAKADSGDRVTINFKGTIEGVAF